MLDVVVDFDGWESDAAGLDEACVSCHSTHRSKMSLNNFEVFLSLNNFEGSYQET